MTKILVYCSSLLVDRMLALGKNIRVWNFWKRHKLIMTPKRHWNSFKADFTRYYEISKGDKQNKPNFRLICPRPQLF